MSPPVSQDHCRANHELRNLNILCDYMFAHHNLVDAFCNGSSSLWQVGECYAMGQSINTYLGCFSWILAMSLASYLDSEAQLQNRDIKIDLTDSSVHFPLCVWCKKKKAPTLELTSSSVVHWQVRKDFDGFIEKDFYKYVLDTESNWL